MPPGTPYRGFLKPTFPTIRVDEFTEVPGLSTSVVYLLSHTHSDHIGGLQAQSFASVVYCSYDAKEMLLRHEVFRERDMLDHDLRAEKMRTYKHLKVDPLRGPNGELYYHGSRDLLRPLPLNTPTSVAISANEQVIITLIDANHCPGAVMFLIEGVEGCVLHTGDFRAEPWFLESIKQNTFLQPYLADLHRSAEYSGPRKVLDAIYLDTASVMQTDEVPTKADATRGLISLLQLYPKSIYIYINSWTWGYEDILKAIAKVFNTKIHFDRYKYNIYAHISDPALREIGTKNPSETRFHACERFDRCELVDVDQSSRDAKNSQREKRWNHISKTGNRVVYVNPVTMSMKRWEEYQADTTSRLLKGEEINCLLVPLQRHSTLPELKSFVSLFRPRSMVPNTLLPSFGGIDGFAIQNLFSPCLSGENYAAIPSTPSKPFSLSLLPKPLLMELNTVLLQLEDQIKSEANHVDKQKFSERNEDVTLKNVVGDGATEIVTRWISTDMTMGRRVELLREWLGFNHLTEPEGGPTSDDSALHSPDYHSLEGDSSQIGDDERERTMHALFAPAGTKLPWHGYDSSSELGSQEAGGLLTLISSPARPPLAGFHILPLTRLGPPNQANPSGPVRSTSGHRNVTVDASLQPPIPASVPETGWSNEASKHHLAESGPNPKRRRVTPDEMFASSALETPGNRTQQTSSSNTPQAISVNVAATKNSYANAMLAPSTSIEVSKKSYFKSSHLPLSAFLQQTLDMMEEFATVCPELVQPSHYVGRDKLTKQIKVAKLKEEKARSGQQSHPESLPSNDQSGQVPNADWNRSRRIAREVKGGMEEGKRVILPPLRSTLRPSVTPSK